MTTKADTLAAERVLKAAVKRAVLMLREQYANPRIRIVVGGVPTATYTLSPNTVWYLPSPDPEPDPVIAMLTAAGTAAELLLECA